MIFTSVLLPAPFSPRSAWISLRPTVRSTRSLARQPGNCLVIPFSDRYGPSLTAVSLSMLPKPPAVRRLQDLDRRAPRFIPKRRSLVGGSPAAHPAHRALCLHVAKRTPTPRATASSRRRPF